MNEAQLRADVYQSQSIERIRVDEHSLRFKLHLQATQYVYELASQGVWPNVQIVHYKLMTLDDDPGMFRTWGVYLASKRTEKKSWCPSATYVPQLMETWERYCRVIRENKDFFEDRLQQACLNQYYHFLTIHPFSDGNGRTGRLMYNALRLAVGLPWYTFTTDIHPLFVEKLREYEKKFKCDHIDFYDPDLE